VACRVSDWHRAFPLLWDQLQLGGLATGRVRAQGHSAGGCLPCMIPGTHGNIHVLYRAASRHWQRECMSLWARAITAAEAAMRTAAPMGLQR
jgi:hypothetical protein